MTTPRERPIPDTAPRKIGIVEVDHELKTWPEFFRLIWQGAKTFELRRDDRDFRVGDALCLSEFDPEAGVFSGSYVLVEITHILRDAPQFGLMPGFCVLSFRWICAHDGTAERTIRELQTRRLP